MGNTLEDDYLDFIQIQGLKDQIDLPRVAAELQIDEEELFDFVSQRVLRLEEQGLSPQNVGEYLGTAFLFGYWLRGIRG